MEEARVQVDVRSPDEGAEIDRCPACGGVFLDFFDGEPSAIARGLQPWVDDDDEPEGQGARPEGVVRCPDCELEMGRVAYLERGPDLARCSGCLGVFLSPGDMEALARMRWKPLPEAPRGLIARLKALLGH